MSRSVQMGKRIRMQREILGITREELAEQIGVSPRFCYDLEMGLKGMSVSTLSNLVTVLGVSADYLLFGESPEDKGCATGISLIESCPPEKSEYLNKIISCYLQALKDPEEPLEDD